MIGPGSNVRVYLACSPTDLRKGIGGLAALAQEQLRKQPCSGAVFAFRGRRGDRLKLLHWDGRGFCLYYKILERGRFPWPVPLAGSPGRFPWPVPLAERRGRRRPPDAGAARDAVGGHRLATPDLVVSAPSRRMILGLDR